MTFPDGFRIILIWWQLQWRENLTRKFAVFAVVAALAVRSLMSFAPDGFVRAAFCIPPARAATFYYGVPLDAETVTFTAHGVSMEVTRACAAIDFFSLVFGFLAATAFSFRGGSRAARIAAAAGVLPAAYVVTIVANSLRLVALVPIDSAFPRSAVPIIHLVAGASVFLGVFASLYCMLRHCKCISTEASK